jgi:hypothetical protein
MSPRGGASGAAMTAATSRSTSRLPVPRGAGPRAVMGGTVQSRSPSRGAGQLSSHKDEAAAFGATRLLWRGTARAIPPG